MGPLQRSIACSRCKSSTSIQDMYIQRQAKETLCDQTLDVSRAFGVQALSATIVTLKIASHSQPWNFHSDMYKVNSKMRRDSY